MASKRSLATKLGVVAGFEEPRVALEQYPTPPDLAAHVVHLADLHGDVDGRTVLDLGTGTGMLALAAALRGPARVLGVELDRDALLTATGNQRRVAASAPVHWIQADATRLPLTVPDPVTVVMNPPFGARDGNRNADRGFLATASRVATVSYSVHNAGSREFVEAFAADEGGEVTHAFAADFAIDAQFDHHSDESRDIDAEVYRIEWA
ncbi:RNA methyltransferase [Halorubrum sp. Ib24]|uniref:METTL5 family protein n=1 Tax=unclassified Halorubrum TaxID=2642239 RepID=UPI000B991375|nr:MULTISPECIES: METTL5 family protein [unclassified Halorubrum]OYR42621.1 RNA methyltransferase [Halorubrum sp. Ib24]OYR48313.1 RNA methyltransferase [Halorubrum sp. Eb13]OYR55751.1 RNA methyltransferase [Halorubrum sp. Ea1]